MAKGPPGRPLHRTLTFWTMCGLGLGMLCGAIAPEAGERMRFLADAFISLMTMLIGPVMFTTVAGGLASLGGRRPLGSLSLKAVVYFEAVTTLALVTGMLVGNLVGLLPSPGTDPEKDAGEVASLQRQAQSFGNGSLSLDAVVPHSLSSAVIGGNAVHTLVVAGITGVALVLAGRRGAPVLDLINRSSHLLFCMVRIVVTGAPAAAFGGAAYTTSQIGTVPLGGLAGLIGAFYLTCAVVVFGGLGLLARAGGFSLWRLVRYLRHEILVAIGTSSSGPVFPRVLRKLELAGAPRSTSAPVLAGGYSLHLVGTCLYIAMAAMFVAAATGSGLSLGDQLFFLAMAMIVSKSAVGVTGSGLLTLIATLSVTQSVPLGAVGLIIGIDRIMSEARAVTNLIANSVATLVITKWSGQLDLDRLTHTLSARRPPELDWPEDDPTVVEIHISDGT
ncbi:cation:dicarboxylase symporter family transporter [Streptomyces hygroscopicus]|uniref:cation:dicarboxylate symporter family transporter n=1 Tax=Streptomyces hygroscopicus TaxID=1912 RepID=UPI0007C6E508|nr:cation:dicarboxylase symporter family transporter [Streptomyces hygroscopicus]